jgi:hypothetical protein
MSIVSHRSAVSACLFAHVAILGACGAAPAPAEPAGSAGAASPAVATPSGTTAPSSAAMPSQSASAAGKAGTSGALPVQAATAATAAGAAGSPAAANVPAKPSTAEQPPEAGAASSGEPSPDGMSAAAGGGAEAGAGGSIAAAGSGGAESAPAREDPGKGDGGDVITIGDSWMSNTLGTGDAIQGALQRLTMQPYRHYAVQGVMLMSASAFGAAIPSQYQTAKRLDPNIKTVVMTGGGNDIIQNPGVQAACNEGTQECVDLLNRISDTLNELWTEMAADGVQDVVYIRYSKDAGSTSDKVRGMQKPIDVCTSGKIRCHSIDSTEAVMAELQDGIHPTRAANDRLAKVIWDVMEKEGVRR